MWSVKCDQCEFQNIHQPGLKSHKTKIHGEKINHPCDQCEEMYHILKTIKIYFLDS